MRQGNASHADVRSVGQYQACSSCHFLVDGEASVCPFCRAPQRTVGGPVGPTVASAAPFAAGPPAGYQLPPPPPHLAPSPVGSWRRRIVTSSGIVAVLAIAAVAAIAVGHRAGDPYAKAWDPRIEPLARFVEEHRGGEFLHPVYVDFLDAAAFDTEVTSGDGAVSTEDAAVFEKYAGLYRAFGLASGKLDLAAAGTQIATEDVAAYYSPKTKRVTMNSADLDAAARVTLVHELTHAWQDQHLDLDRLEKKLGPEQQEPYQAMVEGDASRIEQLYRDSLDPDELTTTTEMEQQRSDEVDLEGLPAALVAQFGAPYVFGEDFMNLLVELKGESAVNDAIRIPPSSSEQLLDPFAYFDNDDPEKVTAPDHGGQLFDAGVNGAVFFYLVFNERLGSRDALLAADGWDGDAYRAVTRDGRSCMDGTVVVEDGESGERFAAALDVWAKSIPGNAVTTVRTGRSIEYTACDPGVDAKIPPSMAGPHSALTLPHVRIQLEQAVIEGGGTRKVAACYGNGAIAALTLDQLVVKASPETAASIDALFTRIAQECLAGS
jgi:hypothetical protein